MPTHRASWSLTAWSEDDSDSLFTDYFTFDQVVVVVVVDFVEYFYLPECLTANGKNLSPLPFLSYFVTHLPALLHFHWLSLILTPFFLQQLFICFRPITLSGGAVAQRVEHWSCDQHVVSSNPTRGKSCVTTLGNFFTPMRIFHQAV